MKRILCCLTCFLIITSFNGCELFTSSNDPDKQIEEQDEQEPVNNDDNGKDREDKSNKNGENETDKVYDLTKPEEVLKIYFEGWQKEDFSKMYDLTSERNKSKISMEEFINKYMNIHDRINADIMETNINSPVVYDPVDPNRSVIPYSIKIGTSAGEISYESNVPMVKENSENWKVEWSSRLIFPELEEGNTVAVRLLKGKRGEIRDKNGLPIAINGKMANVGVVPERFSENINETKEKLANILGMEVDNINKKLSASYVKPYMFIPLKEIRASRTEKLSQLRKIPAVMIKDTEIRDYPLKEKASHLSGYVQIVNEKDLEKGYAKDDLIGRTGIEEFYEEDLHPVHGEEIFICNKNGYTKKVLVRREPQNGKNIKLAIDSEIQVCLYNQLKNDAAAGIALNPVTGEVLALVSTPSFEPNKFVTGMSDSEWNDLSSNPARPLFNRFQARYCPGSIIKPVIASIALEKDIIEPETEKNIDGLSWQRHGGWGGYHIKRISEYENPTNLEKAFIYSDNIFFAQLAIETGGDNILEGAQKFGFGEQVPFIYDLAISRFDADNSFKSEIQLADSGYGQGEILVNPLHLALVFSSFTNDGTIPLPLLENKDSNDIEVFKENIFSGDTGSLIMDYLTKTITNTDGTAHEAFIDGLPLAGKTGTAELKGKEMGKDGAELGWFAAMNTKDPELLVLIMVEDVEDRGGSHYAVPLVKNVFEQILMN